MTAARRPCLALTLNLTRLCHVHRRASVCACKVWAGCIHVRARLCDARAATIAELGMRCARRLVLALHLRDLRLLLLRRLLQAHLLHLTLTHQLSVVVLVVGSLLGNTLLLLLGLLLLRMLLRLRLRCTLSALLGATSISIGAVG